MKQSLETYDLDLITYMKKKLLRRLGLLSEHKVNKSHSEEMQGSNIFGEDKNPFYSKAFYELNQ